MVALKLSFLHTINTRPKTHTLASDRFISSRFLVLLFAFKFHDTSCRNLIGKHLYSFPWRDFGALYWKNILSHNNNIIWYTFISFYIQIRRHFLQRSCWKASLLHLRVWSWSIALKSTINEKPIKFKNAILEIAFLG